MTATAVDAVQARIAEIKTRFEGPSSSTSATSFQDTLASVLGSSPGTSSSLDTLSASMSATSTNSSPSGDAVVADAKKYLGIPYVWGGTDPSKGLDCSGLVQVVYKDLGISLPRVAADQARQGTKVDSLAQAKPGDLVAFGSPVDHIGIYAGDNKMIVAPKRGDVVKIQEVYKTPTAIRRILPEGQTFSTASLSSLAGAMGTSSTGGISPSLSSKYDSMFVAAGSKYGISPNVLAAVAKQESGFNPNAGSGAGAQGLMQFMPSTAKGLGVNPYDPASAIDGAARMLQGLTQKFGSTDLALAAYNAGSGAVQKYGGIPPFQETQNYVRNVLAMARQGGGR